MSGQLEDGSIQNDLHARENMKVNCWYQLQNKERIYNWNTFYLEALFLFFQGHLKHASINKQ